MASFWTSYMDNEALKDVDCWFGILIIEVRLKIDLSREIKRMVKLYLSESFQIKDQTLKMDE